MVQVAPLGVPLFIYLFTRPLASVCDVPGTRVKGFFSPHIILIPFPDLSGSEDPGLFSVAEATLSWASGGRPGEVTSPDPTPEAPDPRPAADLGALSLGD